MPDALLNHWIEQLKQTDDEYPPELRAHLLAAGPAAVPALIDVLAEELHAETGSASWAPLYAAELLGEIGDTRAVPVLLTCLERCDGLDLLYERAHSALLHMGTAIIDACLERYAAISNPRLRDGIAGVLSQLSSKEERIYQVLVETLQRTPELGAAYLAEFGDARALPLLSQTFDALPLQNDAGPLANHVFIELRCAIEDLGGQLTQAQVRKAAQADESRRRFVAALDGLSAQSRVIEDSGGAVKGAATGNPVTMPAKSKWGRNEPCWCGSGKKYKKCHLRLEY